MLTLNAFIDIIGWIGAALLLLAVNSGYHGALPSVAVNAVWIVIGLGALLHAHRDRVTQATEL